jgi:protocatechuate 3,4-dioxygenase beta subunit
LALDPLEALVIEGVVLDPKGAPVPEADVELSSAAGGVSRTQTEVDGRFVTQALPLDLYDVRVTASGFALGSAQGVAPGGPVVKVVLARGGSLVGRAVGPDGQGVAATLHVGGAGFFPPRVVLADDAGAFEVRGLPAGSYQVLAFAGDLGSAWPVEVAVRGPDAPSPVEVPMRQGHTLRLRIQGGVVSVGGGADTAVAVEGALVTLASEPLHVLALYDVSDSRGEVSFRGLPAGRYFLGVRAPGFLSDTPRWVEVPSPDVTAITLGRGVTVEGQALDRDGRPVSGAKATAYVTTTEGAFWIISDDRLGVLHRLVRPDGLPIGPPPRRWLTNAEGRFSISGLPPGEVSLEVSKSGLIPARTAKASLREGELSGGHTLTLLPGVGVQGELRGPDGGPVAGATVRWRLASDVGFWRAQARTTSGGAFAFDAVGADVVFEAIAPTYAPLVAPMRFDVRAAAPQRVVLQFEGGEGGVFGHVLGPSGAVVAGADVAAWQVGASAGAAASCRARTDATGVFRLTRCGQGRRRVEVKAAGAAPAWAEVEVGRDLEVRLTAGASASAQVVGAGGVALARARVSAAAMVEVAGGAAFRWEQAWSVAGGAWAQAHLPPGDYTWTVSADGYAPQTVRGRVAEGDAVALGEVVLHPLQQVSGVVVEYYRAPASGARLWVEGAPSQAVTADGEGRFRLILPAGVGDAPTLEAVHWLHGRGRAALGGALARGEDVVLTLNLPLDEGQAPWAPRFAADGVTLMPEGKGWAVASLTYDSLWRGGGLQVGDLVESVSPAEGPPRAVTVVRKRRRQTLRRPASAEEP